MKLVVRVRRPSGIEEEVPMNAFPCGEIMRSEYDRAVRLTRAAGRGEILGVVAGRIIEPLGAAEVAQIKAQTTGGRQFYGIGSGLAEIRERNAKRERGER